jgi:hypothetical protein
MKESQGFFPSALGRDAPLTAKLWRNCVVKEERERRCSSARIAMKGSRKEPGPTVITSIRAGSAGPSFNGTTDECSTTKIMSLVAGPRHASIQIACNPAPSFRHPLCGVWTTERSRDAWASRLGCSPPPSADVAEGLSAIPYKSGKEQIWLPTYLTAFL